MIVSPGLPLRCPAAHPRPCDRVFLAQIMEFSSVGGFDRAPERSLPLVASLFSTILAT
jgi:hypothetical protein